MCALSSPGAATTTAVSAGIVIGLIAVFPVRAKETAWEAPTFTVITSPGEGGEASEKSIPLTSKPSTPDDPAPVPLATDSSRGGATKPSGSGGAPASFGQ